MLDIEPVGVIFLSEPNAGNPDFSHADSKLILLYLINKIDIPLTNSQISQFAMEENFMHYFTLQQSLSEMVENGYLESTQENNDTHYTITGEGLTTLGYFEKQIPPYIRNTINKYVNDNRKSIKRDYEITANYFYVHESNEYMVKCGVYDDETVLMEINVSVVNREQAKFICANWKQNVNKLYGSILLELIDVKKNDEELEVSKAKNTP